MNLKIARVKRGLSQDELAKVCGVSRITIHKLETKGADTVQGYILKKVADSLGQSIQSLFFEE